MKPGPSRELLLRIAAILSQKSDGSGGPEVVIEFTDDTTFTICLKTSVSVEAKSIRDEGNQPQILKTYTDSSSIPLTR